MKRALDLFALSIALVLMAIPCHAQQQNNTQNKELNVPEQAEKESIRLQSLLKLEDWQVFKVDSLLNTNLEGYKKDMEGLKTAGAQNEFSYYTISDKWAERIDSAYMKIFNGEQWKRYQKTGAAKAARERAKRRANAAESTKRLREGN
ncbi:MAG: hypothetical protein LKK19_07085 [Bacteroidales bacterium]|jgi:hypothetical protein|nr:hypothetical protein [Bacteroidales bacterium]MCI2122449.1 hypothetical protein [Bacteroidales bacterium]MCI2145105.1 hypothetical protein [Bacteroidales bacterium]